ncbi:hypothetical protein E2320_016307 [Naja naja]|nr:hypothetical protein E2320_016307 [Naja naja]
MAAQCYFPSTDGWSGAHNPSQQIHMDFLRPVDQASPSAPWPVGTKQHCSLGALFCFCTLWQCFI